MPCAFLSMLRSLPRAGPGWQSVSTMKDHVDAHLSGALQGDLPGGWLQAQGRQRCPVCGLSVSIRHDTHPTCRPSARAGLGHGGAPRAANPTLPSFDEIQASQTPTLRCDTSPRQPDICGGKPSLAASPLWCTIMMQLLGKNNS